jgi:hypothetical protein
MRNYLFSSLTQASVLALRPRSFQVWNIIFYAQMRAVDPNADRQSRPPFKSLFRYYVVISEQLIRSQFCRKDLQQMPTSNLVFLLGSASPPVQSLLIAGIFTLLVIVAFSSRAGANLSQFLRDLRDIAPRRTRSPRFSGKRSRSIHYRHPRSGGNA